MCDLHQSPCRLHKFPAAASIYLTNHSVLQRVDGHRVPTRWSASHFQAPASSLQSRDGVAGTEAEAEAAAAARGGGHGDRPWRRRRPRRSLANAGVGGPRRADAPRQQGPQAVHGREQLRRREGHPEGGFPADAGRRGAGPRHQRDLLLPRRARARRRPRRRPFAQRRGQCAPTD